MRSSRVLDPGCSFCRIASGEGPAEIVFDAPDVMAFLPTNPATFGHVLIVPKWHVSDLWKLHPGETSSLMDAALLVGGAIKFGISPDGINMITSAGEAASQSVFHLHLHLVPRWNGDRIGNIWPRKKVWPEKEKREMAKAIRDRLR